MLQLLHPQVLPMSHTQNVLALSVAASVGFANMALFELRLQASVMRLATVCQLCIAGAVGTTTVTPATGCGAYSLPPILPLLTSLGPRSATLHAFTRIVQMHCP